MKNNALYKHNPTQFIIIDDKKGIKSNDVSFPRLLKMLGNYGCCF
jgi:hypothetical protein